jgi:hypothetical protein
VGDPSKVVFPTWLLLGMLAALLRTGRGTSRVDMTSDVSVSVGLGLRRSNSQGSILDLP